MKMTLLPVIIFLTFESVKVIKSVSRDGRGDCSLNFASFSSMVDSSLEKIIRSDIKTRIEHELDQKTVVIVNATNYIKGYRYELYCIAKCQSTTHCVVWSNPSSHESE